MQLPTVTETVDGRDTSVGGPETQSSGASRRRAKSESIPRDVENVAARQRSLLKENLALVNDLTRMSDKEEPVHFDTFRQTSVRRHSRMSDEMKGKKRDEREDLDSIASSQFNTELLEAYLAYCKSIGHAPNLRIGDNIVSDDRTSVRLDAEHVVSERPDKPVHQYFWTRVFGTRYSKRLGCMQFWAWLGIGVGVIIWFGFSLSSLHLNEVLHLDAFIEQDVQITQDYTYLHFVDEVDFHLTYTIETPRLVPSRAGASRNSSSFNALLLNEDEYEHYVRGEPFEYIPEGSTLRTIGAYMPRTYIQNTIGESMYFVIQPCFLTRDPTHDYCQTSQLPSSVTSTVKIYHLNNVAKMRHHAAWEHFDVTYLSVDPEPLACSSSGLVGSAYLVLFLPYVLITCFGLRVFQMMRHCESFPQNIERMYARELAVPENEVDYWQPMPWDRKVPKTRLCGPCCWKKFRCPFEPFYTWWRHENYFTWIFCPYRNEQLSRGERTLIVVCSLYVTFYVLFVLVMVRESYGRNTPVLTSVVFFAMLGAVVPSAGKALFKELFKLIFRHRRKYVRARAARGHVQGVSFRVAFLLQVLVALLLTLAQGPIFYIWAFRSCLFLTQFIYYGVLAAIARMSLLGLAQDFAWYLILKTWGWKDLCPYCTERIKHCNCLNDEVLVLAVEHVGPKWELIRTLDRLLARQTQYEAQFAWYTPEQLRERWNVLVKRAAKHMEKVDKLRAYRAKKQQEAWQQERNDRSSTRCLSMTSFRPTEHDNAGPVSLCHLREQKILALNSKIQLDEFEKHYDANIADVFHALARSVMKHRRHEKPAKGKGVDKEARTGNDRRGPSVTMRPENAFGETMWVFDTPAQRLERRTEENLQRKRAFCVLKDYAIEEVGISSKTAMSRAAQDTRQAPLISIQSQAVTRRQEDVVVLTPGVVGGTRDDATSSERRLHARLDDARDLSLSDLERGPYPSTFSFQSDGSSRVYAVTERRQTLLRRLSAFAAWALDYDPKVAQQS